MQEVTTNPLVGGLICALGGFAGAVFAVPFRGIKGVKYESYWLFYALVGLLVFPLLLAFTTCPKTFSVIGGTDTAVLAKCIGFGALWGLGGLTWGLMIRYLGLASDLRSAADSARRRVRSFRRLCRVRRTSLSPTRVHSWCSRAWWGP